MQGFDKSRYLELPPVNIEKLLHPVTDPPLMVCHSDNNVSQTGTDLQNDEALRTKVFHLPEDHQLPDHCPTMLTGLHQHPNVRKYPQEPDVLDNEKDGPKP